ncbi:MAG: excinuclease Cho [Burkholderiales bacterium]|nr:excinuclease Cho [Burkholderiales bacterium]
MPRPDRLRVDTTSDLTYEPPAALREAAARLPGCPGVYTFHGEEGDLPLYIGKSVHLRQRVLSHLRNPDEVRMLRQTRRISHICTAGEVGALLLEAQLIKQQQPLMNQRLRRNRQLCALHLADSGQPVVVDARSVNFAHTPRLYGLFASRHAALERLWQLADEHRLCGVALGLERAATGKPCFRSMVKRCAGACCGLEPLDAHHARLQAALAELQVACWPYPGAVGLVETCQPPSGSPQPAEGQPRRQIHVVRDWCYLGSAPSLTAARKLDTVAAGFDGDGYLILCKPLLSGALKVLPL